MKKAARSTGYISLVQRVCWIFPFYDFLFTSCDTFRKSGWKMTRRSEQILPNTVFKVPQNTNKLCLLVHWLLAPFWRRVFFLTRYGNCPFPLSPVFCAVGPNLRRGSGVPGLCLPTSTVHNWLLLVQRESQAKRKERHGIVAFPHHWSWCLCILWILRT